MNVDLVLFSSFFFLFGLSIGSFLLVLADRIPRNEGFTTGGSYCEYCHHGLSSLDLIPVISFLFLRGKCRYCKKKISWYYPGSELLTGSLFVITYVTIGTTSFPTLLFSIFIVSCLIVIFFADLQSGIIPDKIVYPAIVVIALFQLITQFLLFPLYMYSAIGAGGFFLLLFLLTKGKGMGFGDVKFAVLMGLVLGFPGIVYSLYIAFLTGATLSLILILWKQKTLKSTIPFGPFLVFATLIVLLFPQVVEAIVKVALP